MGETNRSVIDVRQRRKAQVVFTMAKMTSA